MWIDLASSFHALRRISAATRTDRDGIDRRPAREVDDDRSDDGADRAEQVAHHVQDGPFTLT